MLVGTDCGLMLKVTSRKSFSRLLTSSTEIQFWYFLFWFCLYASKPCFRKGGWKTEVEKFQ